MLIVRIARGDCHKSAMEIMQSCAAAQLVRGSLLVYMDGGLCDPIDVDMPQHSEVKNALQWSPMHTGRHFKVFQLSA